MNETNLKPVAEKKPCVLAVEDSGTSLAILVSLLEELGYDTLDASDGREALDVIERERDRIDVIVLDKVMPNMDGLEVVKHLKQDPKAYHIPVIMVTGSKKPEEIKEGIDAGVFYYLTKPYEEDVFKSILSSATHEAHKRSTLREELKKHQSSFGFLKNASFEIQKMADVEPLACFIANFFPDPEIALPGIASLLSNAVEHGNLEIGYDKKADLINRGALQKEIEDRQNIAPFNERIVKADVTRTDDEVTLRIEDEGRGFDSSKYMEIDPARALDPHGRGIAQANKISFDRIEYNDKGNIVTAVSTLSSAIDW